MIVRPSVFRHVNADWTLLKAEWELSHPMCQEKWWRCAPASFVSSFGGESVVWTVVVM
jgi:hypothetical protein